MDDDMALDVYETFIDTFKKGFDPAEVHDAFLSEWLDTAQQTGEEVPFFLGLAKGLWACGALTDEDLSELAELIDSDAAVAGYEDPRRRRMALRRFLKKLSVPKAKPLRHQKRQPGLMKPMFVAGTCLAIQVGDSFFGGVVMVQSKHSGPRTVWYRLVMLRQLFVRQPPLEYFESRDWLIQDRARKREEVRRERAAMPDMPEAIFGHKPEHWPDQPWAYWCLHRELKSCTEFWSVVGNMELVEGDPVIDIDMYVGETFGGLDSVVDTLRRKGTIAAE